MKKTFKKLIALTSAVSLTALSVAGCGGSSPDFCRCRGREANRVRPLQKQKWKRLMQLLTGYVRWYGLHTGDKITIKIAHVSQEGVPIDVASKN